MLWLEKENMLGHLFHECKGFILRIKTTLGKIRSIKSRTLFKGSFHGVNERHPKRTGRILHLSASTSRFSEAESGHGIGWCDGCLGTYDVVILAKGESLIVDYFRRGRSGVFIREGELPQFCPRCWRRLEPE